MKKILSILSLILVFAVMALPAGAAPADEMSITAIQISDPVIIIDDIPPLNFIGATLQAAHAANADGSLVQLFIDLLYNNTAINSAVMQFDPNGIAAYLGGMSQAYGIPSAALKVFGESITQFMEDIYSSVPSISGAVPGTDAANEGADASMADLSSAYQQWALPGQIADTVNAYIAANSVPAENYTRNISLSGSETAVEYQSFSVNCNALIPQITALLDADETAMQLLEFLKESGDITAASYTELIPLNAFDYTITTGTSSGDNFSCEDVVLRMDDGDVPINFAVTTVKETTEDGSIGQYDLTIYPESEEFAGEKIYVTFDIDTNSGGTAFIGHAGSYLGSESYDMALMGTYSDIGFSASLTDSEGDINAFCSCSPSSFALNLNIDGESMSIYASRTENSFNVGFSAGDGTRFDISYVSINDPAYLFKGQTTVNIASEGQNVSLRFNLAGLSGTMASPSVYIQPGAYVDITTMTAEQGNYAGNEAATVLENTLNTFIGSIPGLSSILDYYFK